MSRNGSGVYSLPSQYLATTGETITALQHNLPLTDIAADLNAARPVSSGGTGASTAATARDNLGLKIGTNVQAQNALLQSIAGLATSADLMIYTTASNEAATTALTAFGRSLIDDADAAAAQTTLGVPPNERTVSGGGLATGGGDLSANRTITVTEASQAQAQAGTASDVAMTPRRTTDAMNARIYTGSTQNQTDFPLGHTLLVYTPTALNRNQSSTIYLSSTFSNRYTTDSGDSDGTVSGTWRSRGTFQGVSGFNFALMERTA